MRVAILSDIHDNVWKLEAAVESVLELGKVPRGVLAVDGVVGAAERGFDVAQHRVDPDEGWVLSGSVAAADDVALMGVSALVKGIEAGKRIGRDRGIGTRDREARSIHACPCFQAQSPHFARGPRR